MCASQPDPISRKDVADTARSRSIVNPSSAGASIGRWEVHGADNSAALKKIPYYAADRPITGTIN
jgi:hypothetical protein